MERWGDGWGAGMTGAADGRAAGQDPWRERSTGWWRDALTENLRTERENSGTADRYLATGQPALAPDERSPALCDVQLEQKHRMPATPPAPRLAPSPHAPPARESLGQPLAAAAPLAARVAPPPLASTHTQCWPPACPTSASGPCFVSCRAVAGFWSIGATLRRLESLESCGCLEDPGGRMCCLNLSTGSEIPYMQIVSAWTVLASHQSGTRDEKKRKKRKRKQKRKDKEALRWTRLLASLHVLRGAVQCLVSIPKCSVPLLLTKNPIRSPGRTRGQSMYLASMYIHVHFPWLYVGIGTAPRVRSTNWYHRPWQRVISPLCVIKRRFYLCLLDPTSAGLS